MLQNLSFSTRKEVFIQYLHDTNLSRNALISENNEQQASRGCKRSQKGVRMNARGQAMATSIISPNEI